jgi:queuine/archaeosine tRNA-ribosyltransferase
MEILEKAGGLHKFMNWDRNIFDGLVDTKCIRSRQIENKKKKVEVQIAY